MYRIASQEFFIYCKREKKSGKIENPVVPMESKQFFEFSIHKEGKALNSCYTGVKAVYYKEY